jgi:hypothetical protein
MLSNEGQQIVMRKQIKFDRDQTAVAINCLATSAIHCFNCIVTLYFILLTSYCSTGDVHKDHDKSVHVTTAWRVLRSRMEELPQIWRIAANILNKQSPTAGKGGPPAWWLGEVLKSPHRKNVSCYEPFTKSGHL